jgi:predicted nucleic acid-binding Zn ribbon protein
VTLVVLKGIRCYRCRKRMVTFAAWRRNRWWFNRLTCEPCARRRVRHLLGLYRQVRERRVAADRHCAVCGKSIPLERTMKAGYCGRSCYRFAMNLNKYPWLWKRCDYCGREFQTKYKLQRFCRERCQQEASKERRGVLIEPRARRQA